MGVGNISAKPTVHHFIVLYSSAIIKPIVVDVTANVTFSLKPIYELMTYEYVHCFDVAVVVT